MKPAGIRTIPILLALLGCLCSCESDLHVGRLERTGLGVFVSLNKGEGLDAIEALEELIDQRFGLIRQFYGWQSDFPGELEALIIARGSSPVFSFKGPVAATATESWAQIADVDNSPVQDRLHDIARRCRDLDGEVFIIFHEAPEQDASDDDAAVFVAAWRQIVTVFRAEEATRVRFVWTLSSGAFPARANAWFPGEDWVDWIGVTGFNWSAGLQVWRHFAQVFASFREWSQVIDKPIMLVSVGSGENPESNIATSKAQWIREMHDSLRSWPQVQAVLWYQDEGPDATRDWRFNSSVAALAAFREIAGAAIFDLSGQSLP